MTPSLAVLTVMIGRLLEPESWNGEEVRGGRLVPPQSFLTNKSELGQLLSPQSHHHRSGIWRAI